MFELGSVYPAALNVADSDGNPANAGTITLAITLPDTTVVTPSVLNPPDTEGQYQYPYLTVQSGRHYVRWVSTFPNTAYTDVFDVKDAQPLSILSLASVKQTLGMASSWTDDDDELREKLAAMTAGIENYKHEVVVMRTITQEIGWAGGLGGRGFPGSFRLRLDSVPVIALQSLVAADGSYTWDVSQLDVNRNSGLVTVISGPPIRGRVIAVYTAGYSLIPYNYIEAAKVLIQHVWESRRGPGGLDGVLGPEELADYRHYTSLPRKVTEWLGPPRPIVA